MFRIALGSLSLAALLATAPLVAQQASFTPYGTACTATGSTTPAIGHRGLPRIGTAFQVTYSGPNSIELGLQLTEHPMLIIGLTPVNLPIPAFLPTQPAGCTLYPAPEVVFPTPVDRRGTAFEPELTLLVPNDPRLIGGVLHMQWVTPRRQCMFVGCGPVWVVLSDAARVVLGT